MHNTTKLEKSEVIDFLTEANSGSTNLLAAVELVPIDELVILEKNPRKHPKKQIFKIKKSIEKYGFLKVVLVNENNIVVSGEARIMALKEMNVNVVPVLRVANLSEAQIRAFRIVDNKLAEEAEWDFTIFREEIESLLKFDFTLDDLSIEPVDYDKIFFQKDSSDAKVHDKEVEDPSWLDANVPQIAKKGDLVRLGDHFVFCGDSLKAQSFQIVMQGEKAKIVVTDPPYNCPVNGHVCGSGKVKHEEFEMASGEMSDEEFAQFTADFMKNLVEFSEDGSLHYIWCDWRILNTFLNVGKQYYTSLFNIACWVKPTGGLGGMYRSRHELCPIFKNGKAKHQNHVLLGKNNRYRTNVWEYAGVHASSGNSAELLKLHPTVKNTAMLQDILLDSSSKNDVVLDCFGGSGSTLIAAERSGRRARLIEISPRYVDVIIYRYEKETGKKHKIIKNYGEMNDGQ